MNAAERGNIDAQYMLGKCYDQGLGVAKSRKKMCEWMNKAAYQGHREAKERIKKLWFFR